MVVAFIGDIVGRPARKIIGEFLPKVRDDFDIEFSLIWENLWKNGKVHGILGI